MKTKENLLFKGRSRNLASFIFLAVVLLFILPTPVLSKESGKSGNLKETGIIIATINGEPIYKEQMVPLVDQQLKIYEKKGSKRSYPGLIEKIYERELEKIIGHQLLVQASRSLKVKDLEKKVNSEMEMLKKRYPSEELFNVYIMNRYKTDEKLRKFLAQDLTLKKYLNKKGLINPEVPEKDIRDLYERKKPSFITEKSVKVSHIIIRTEKDATPEDLEKAKAKAEMVFEKLKKGGNFEELAVKHSEDDFAAKGGDLGFIVKGYLPLEAEEFAFSMEPGKVSDIIKTSVGYQIVKVVEKKAEEQLSFEKVRNFLVKYLQPKISKEKIASHISELREKAKIEFHRENFKL
ncbi:MAG: peptidylprolyl isomerase [Deltaproteobacteria bacterium]|nr:peptidylprolyl isomerase [Deltaproteobacteria bacterium]